MKKKITSIVFCCIISVFCIGNSNAQEKNLTQIKLKFKMAQIENLQEIQLVYSNDICPGCPADSCKYCPLYSVHKSEFGKSINFKASVSNDSIYHLILIDKTGAKIKLNSDFLFKNEKNNTINLKNINIDELQSK